MATVLYIGTDDGVQTLTQSPTGGWEQHQARQPEFSVEEMLTTERPEVVLAATRGDGVWKSDDGGRSFLKPSYGRPGPGKVRCIAADPVRPERVYVGCEPIDIFVSDDLGAHFERVASLREDPVVEAIDYVNTRVEPHVRDLAVDPVDPNTWYAAMQVGGIYKTSDAGKSWGLLGGRYDQDVHTITIDPENHEHVLIATGGHDARLGTSGGKALFSSADAGSSWRPLALDVYQEYSIPLVATPDEPTVMFAGLANGNPGQWRRESGAEGVLLRSVDHGATWEPVETSGVEDFSRSFVASVAVDPEDGDWLYAALSSGELITSDDRGASWRPLGVQVRGTNDVKVAHL